MLAIPTPDQKEKAKTALAAIASALSPEAKQNAEELLKTCREWKPLFQEIAAAELKAVQAAGTQETFLRGVLMHGYLNLYLRPDIAERTLRSMAELFGEVATAAPLAAESTTPAISQPPNQ